jgi:hypothetical protein
LVTFSSHDEELQPPQYKDDDNEVIDEETPAMRYSKTRTSTGDTTVRATQVDERAPNINLRFFRGLAARTLSQRSRNRDRRARRREARQQQQRASNNSNESQMEPPEEMVATVRPMSNILLEQQQNRSQTTSQRRLGNSIFSSLSQSRFFGSSGTSASDVLINATLVEEEELEYAVAEEMNWYSKHAKVIVPCLCLLLVVLAGSVAGGVYARGKRSAVTPSEVPSTMPSAAPSMDRRPTLVNVRERGYLLCGADLMDNSPELAFRLDLVRDRVFLAFTSLIRPFILTFCIP